MDLAEKINRERFWGNHVLKTDCLYGAKTLIFNVKERHRKHPTLGNILL